MLRPFGEPRGGGCTTTSGSSLEHEFEGVWVGVLDVDKVPDYRLEVTYTDGPALEVDDPYRYLPLARRDGTCT